MAYGLYCAGVQYGGQKRVSGNGRGGSAPYARVPGRSSFGLPGDRTLRSGGTGQVSQWRNENPDAADAPRIAGPLE